MWGFKSCIQGYLGYKNTPVRRSVGRCFPLQRKPRAKLVGLRFLELRKCTKAFGPRVLEIKKTHESGQSVFLKIRPVEVDIVMISSRKMRLLHCPEE